MLGVRGQPWMVSCLCLLQLPSLLILPAADCTSYCPQDQYFHEGRCCNNCPPGKEMRARCRKDSDTQCQTCPEGSYKDGSNVINCEKCTICKIDQGSNATRPCTKEYNAICECVQGTTPKNPMNSTCSCPAGNQLLSHECAPCKAGYFSSEENQRCLPWTDCRSKGEEVEQPGSSTQDVRCSRQHVGSPGPTMVQSSTFPAVVPRVVSRRPTISNAPTRNTTLTATTREFLITPSMSPESVGHLGFWTLVIVVLCIFFGFLAVAILIIILRRCPKKKKGPAVLRGNSGTQSCRLPIQEEQTGSPSSLTNTMDFQEP